MARGAGTSSKVSLSPEYRSVMRLMPGDEKRFLLQKNGIFFLEEIDDSSSYIMTMNLLSDYVLKNKTPVWVLLSSPGGGVVHGFAIYDMLKAVALSGRQVNVVGVGYVASMATVIMQAGTIRYSLPNTQFLVHQVREVLPFFKSEEVTEGRERVKEMERVNDIVLKIITDRSGMELEKLKSLIEKKDLWLNADDARKFGTNGLVDEVITSLPF